MSNTQAFQDLHSKEKKQYIRLIMYFIIAQVAQSRHQLMEYLTCKDGHNRRPFIFFWKLSNWREKRSFKWKCRINGGRICWREVIQYRHIGSGIEYYALSQWTCNCLRQDFRLHNISTITKMTSKVKKILQSLLVH